jgi:hypothetical protein
MPEPVTPVPASQPSSVPATPGTPTPSPVPAPAGMPAQPVVDVEKLQREKAEVEAKLRKQEDDMNRMRSSLQKNQAQQEKEWKKRQEEILDQLEAERVSHLDEEGRKEYERSAALIRAQQLETDLQDAQSRLEELDAYNKAYTYFASQGVPLEALVTDQGYDALFQSGWGWITGEYQRLKTNPAPQTPPPPPPTAPPVNTNPGGTPPPSGQTWADIRRKYGSEDRFMQLVNRGRVSPQEIPGYEAPKS